MSTNDNERRHTEPRGAARASRKPARTAREPQTPAKAEQELSPEEGRDQKCEQQVRRLQELMANKDPAIRRRIAEYLHLEALGGGVLNKQYKAIFGFATESAGAFIDAIRDSVHPRDTLEQMLILQMAWTYVRLARLSSIANDQTDSKCLRVVNDACDRAANTYRRQMLALAEYRRPPRGPFVAVRQANIAQQQVVQNAEIRKSESGNGSNEQGSAAPKALPPHAERADFIAAGRAEPQAVAVEHRAADGGGQGPVKNERDETR